MEMEPKKAPPTQVVVYELAASGGSSNGGLVRSRRLGRHKDTPLALAFSPDGAKLAGGGGGGGEGGVVLGGCREVGGVMEVEGLGEGRFCWMVWIGVVWRVSAEFLSKPMRKVSSDVTTKLNHQLKARSNLMGWLRGLQGGRGEG